MTGSVFAANGYNNTIALNDSELSSSEIDSGGLFGTGVSFLRFTGFVLFGVGVPGSVPLFIRLLIAAWQTAITIFTVGWVISSIWDG